MLYISFLTMKLFSIDFQPIFKDCPRFYSFSTASHLLPSPWNYSNKKLGSLCFIAGVGQLGVDFALLNLIIPSWDFNWDSRQNNRLWLSGNVSIRWRDYPNLLMGKGSQLLLLWQDRVCGRKVKRKLTKFFTNSFLGFSFLESLKRSHDFTRWQNYWLTNISVSLSLFNGMSTFVGYLMPKTFLLKGLYSYYSTLS